MGRIIDRFKGLLEREKCERTINYDKCDLKFGGINTEIPGAKFSLGNFETEKQKIRDASEYAAALDDYQYHMCNICKSLGKDDMEWRKYNGLLVGTIQLLTMFRFVLAAFEHNPETEKARLYDIIDRLQDYLLLVSREVIPNIKDLKEQISKGDVQEVSSRVVSKALNIAGLDEAEVNQFVEELNPQ